MKEVHRKISRAAAMAIAFAATFFALFAFANAAGGFENPLKFPTLEAFIAGFLKVVVMIALPFITLAFVLVGLQFLIAQGKKEDIAKAKMNFVYAVIGALLVLGAWTIATLIARTVVQIVE